MNSITKKYSTFFRLDESKSITYALTLKEARRFKKFLKSVKRRLTNTKRIYKDGTETV